jgi:hypothetical protein
MPGLLELGPMTVEVTVRGSSLTLWPLSVDDVIKLFSEFPQLVGLVTDNKSDRAGAVKDIGPLAIAKVIACSTGELNNPKAIEVAKNLGVGKTTEIVDKIMEITFEDGVGPFVERLVRRTSDVNDLTNKTLDNQSSPQWSAALVGDEPRKPRARPRRDNSASGTENSKNSTQSDLLPTQ